VRGWYNEPLVEAEGAEPIRGSSHSEEERAFLQQRVALLWRAVFLITLGTDVVELLLDPASFMRTGPILDRVSTLSFGLLWLFCRRGHRSWRVLLAVEWVGLAMVVAVITLMGRYLTAEVIAHFAAAAPGTDPGSLALSKAADAYVSITCVLGGCLLFVLRAALVPSPPSRTLVLTSLLGPPFVAVPFFFAPASVGAPALRATLTRADVIAGTPLYIAPEPITSPESVSPPSRQPGRLATRVVDLG